MQSISFFALWFGSVNPKKGRATCTLTKGHKNDHVISGNCETLQIDLEPTIASQFHAFVLASSVISAILDPRQFFSTKCTILSPIIDKCSSIISTQQVQERMAAAKFSWPNPHERNVLLPIQLLLSYTGRPRKIHTSARIYEWKFDTGEWKFTPARPTGRVAFLGLTWGGKCP